MKLNDLFLSRDNRLEKIAKKLGRKTKSADERASWDNAYTDGALIARFEKKEEIPF